jgi:translin
VTTTPDSRHSAETHRQLVPSSVIEGIEVHLKDRERRREEIYQLARALRRRAQSVMISIHEGTSVPEAVPRLLEETRALRQVLGSGASEDEGLARAALQEVAEATLLSAVAEGRVLPGPADLGIDPEEYLLGLGDLVGEVRRLCLDRLAHGDVAGAESRLKEMQQLYQTLLHFDTTRAIVALKPKQDTARALLERTRGEVTTAQVLARAGALPPHIERDS